MCYREGKEGERREKLRETDRARGEREDGEKEGREMWSEGKGMER